MVGFPTPSECRMFLEDDGDQLGKDVLGDDGVRDPAWFLIDCCSATSAVASARLVRVTAAVFCRLSIMRLAIVRRRVVRGTASWRWARTRSAHVGFDESARPGPCLAIGLDRRPVRRRRGAHRGVTGMRPSRVGVSAGTDGLAVAIWRIRRANQVPAPRRPPFPVPAHPAQQESEMLAHNHDRAGRRRTGRQVQDAAAERFDVQVTLVPPWQTAARWLHTCFAISL